MIRSDKKVGRRTTRKVDTPLPKERIERSTKIVKYQVSIFPLLSGSRAFRWVTVRTYIQGREDRSWLLEVTKLTNALVDVVGPVSANELLIHLEAGQNVGLPRACSPSQLCLLGFRYVSR
jgi:hypothetical protein